MCINWWLWAIVIEGCFLCPLTVTISGELQVSTRCKVSAVTRSLLCILHYWYLNDQDNCWGCRLHCQSFYLWSLNYQWFKFLCVATQSCPVVYSNCCTNVVMCLHITRKILPSPSLCLWGPTNAFHYSTLLVGYRKWRWWSGGNGE